MIFAKIKLYVYVIYSPDVIWRINDMDKLDDIHINGGSQGRQALFDVSVYAKHGDINFIVISHGLITQDDFFRR